MAGKEYPCQINGERIENECLKCTKHGWVFGMWLLGEIKKAKERHNCNGPSEGDACQTVLLEQIDHKIRELEVERKEAIKKRNECAKQIEQLEESKKTLTYKVKVANSDGSVPMEEERKNTVP
jgi:hypothetical protein